jgi:hypothetical protein
VVNEQQRSAGSCYQHVVSNCLSFLLVTASIRSICRIQSSTAVLSQQHLHAAAPSPDPDEAHDRRYDVLHVSYRTKSSPP